jgi:hypothetical protein
MTTQQPSPRDIEQARNVVEECTREAGDFSEVQLREHVAQALAQREAEVRAEYAAFADENGKPRKVLGTLPLSADGFFVGFPPGYGGLFRIPYEYGGDERMEQCNPMHMSYDQASRLVMVTGGQWSGISQHPVGSCYSTADAALAARKEGE